MPYAGIPGKGSAFRAIFELADAVGARGCAVVDSDLRSITPEWMELLLKPVLDEEFDFVAPQYRRHKYDGTITNSIVYPLTRALYGKRLRQPIGGDFGFSGRLARHYLGKDVWQTDIARYGIDIWMTTTAITQNFKLCQSNLGVKIHDAKDPGQHLGPMFRQVVYVLFALMERLENYWKPIKGSEPIETFGHKNSIEPEPVSVDLGGVLEKFKDGFQHFSSLWKEIFCAECFSEIQKASELGVRDFHLPTSVWVQILYELAATFHAWKRNRFKIIEVVTPLYYARVASFIRRTWDMTSEAAEEVVEEQALQFEKHKDYLLKVWAEKPPA
jgi:hypothetical protein